MRKLIIVLAILAIAVGVASARQNVFEPREVRQPGRQVVWFFADPLEPPDPGWAHGDYTATAVPHFHVDSYLAYGGSGFSWWCGTFAYDADGGYGNSWDDRLICPPAPWTGFLYPVVTFAYRNDTEPAYDFSYVDAESLGAYVHLNRGFDGVHPWGTTGFYLGNKDDPAQVRFRFVSDGAWSDADGLYFSNGGAFHCDDIMIWDYYTAMVFFFDDVESGGLCTPGVPPSAGDYWHTIANNCKAFSDPTVWVNTSPDTNGAFVPGGVQNWLRTPMVDVSSAATCTTYFVIQFFTPTVDNDYWTETVYMDGVGTQLHAWWGDQCDAGYGPCAHFLGGDDVTALLPATTSYHEWVYYTTDNGAGPDVCDCAGITIDDIGYYGHPISPVEETSWGRVKSMYR